MAKSKSPRKSYPSENLDRFMLRLPEGMRDKIGVAAREANRTMNAEIVARLEASFLEGATLEARIKKIEAHLGILSDPSLD